MIVKRLLILFFIFISYNSIFAQQFLGAEIGMLAINTTGKNFKISLNLYVEESKQPFPSPSTEENVVIFRKLDNALMQRIILKRAKPSKMLDFPNPKCAASLGNKAYIDIFESDVFLDPTIYNSPQGYYIVFDRCCRYDGLNNANNLNNPSIVEVLEFPTVTGMPNSSPNFTPVEGLYACVGQPFTANLSAVDADNDILVYSLIDPMSGFTTTANPYFDLTPRTYRPPINWYGGHSTTKQIIGNPSLTIDPKTGIISLNASEFGAFVFSILVEEYRANKKIGSNRRDYTLKISQCQPPLTVPKVYYGLNGTLGLVKEVLLCPATSAIFDIGDFDSYWEYQWKKDGVDVIGGNGKTFTTAEKGVYTLVKSDANDCAKAVTSDPINVTLTGGLKPLNVTASNLSPCYGETVTLSIDNPPYPVNWSLNGSIFLKTGNSVDVKETGFYYAQLAIATTCPKVQTDDILYVEFGVQKAVTSSPNPDGYPICPNEWARLETDVPTSRPLRYQWYKNGIPIPEGLNSAWDTQEIGNYTVDLSDYGCKFKSQVYKVFYKKGCPIDLESIIHAPTAFSPNDDGLNDEWQIFNIEKFPDAVVRIYNNWGEEIFSSEKGYTNPWNGQTKGTKVPAGMYSYKLELNQGDLKSISGQVMVLH